MHDTLFAPFFAGAAAPGHIWYWDTYVQKNDLWYHFKLFKNAIEGFDPVAESAKPFRADTGNLRVYGLRGKTRTLVWCRDKNSDVHSELRDNIPAKTIKGAKLDLANIDSGIKKVRAYLDWQDKWVDLEIKEGAVVLPEFKRSITVSFEK